MKGLPQLCAEYLGVVQQMNQSLNISIPVDPSSSFDRQKDRDSRTGDSEFERRMFENWYGFLAC